MGTNELSAPPDGGELLDLQERLYALLARRAALYNGNDSSSLPVERAGALMDGIYFTLGVSPDGGPGALGSLLGADLEEAHRRGIASIERRLVRAQRLWAAVRWGLPPIENRSLYDTLTSMGGCWKRYDCRFFPQEVPCDIDYQLCQSVPETLLGVDYIIEYLKRLSIENELLGRFAPGRATALLECACPDYRGLLINLAEPVAVNALGLVLAGDDPTALTVTPGARARIAALLAPLPDALRAEVMERAAEALCAFLGVSQARARRYWRTLAAGLVPRVGAALDAGELGGIFLSVPVL